MRKGGCMRYFLLALGIFSMAVRALPCAAQEPTGSPELGRMHLSARVKNLLSPEELKGTCAGLTMTLQFHIERMKRFKTPAEKELKEASPSLFGGRPSVVQFILERDRAHALNAILDSRGCKTVAIEDALRDAQSDKEPSPQKAAKGRRAQ